MKTIKLQLTNSPERVSLIQSHHLLLHHEFKRLRPIHGGASPGGSFDDNTCRYLTVIVRTVTFRSEPPLIELCRTWRFMEDSSALQGRSAGEEKAFNPPTHTLKWRLFFLISYTNNHSLRIRNELESFEKKNTGSFSSSIRNKNTFLCFRTSQFTSGLHCLLITAPRTQWETAKEEMTANRLAVSKGRVLLWLVPFQFAVNYVTGYWLEHVAGHK